MLNLGGLVASTGIGDQRRAVESTVRDDSNPVNPVDRDIGRLILRAIECTQQHSGRTVTS
jgi:hypothetical protein